MFAGSGYSVLGSVDAYGHLIVSKLDANGKGKYHLYLFLLSPYFECWFEGRSFLAYSSYFEHH